MKALGMIEVSGYLAAVEAADAALKAANVKLMGIEIVKAGISNVEVVGDVGAVQASVDAGRAAADALGLLRGSHVIPRPHDELLKLFPSLGKKKEIISLEEVKDNSNKENNNENSKIHKNTVIGPLETSTKDKVEDINKSKAITQEILSLERTLENYKNKKEKASKENIEKDEKVKYEAIKVETLRNMVRDLNLPNMSNKQIKQEKKDKLIKILEEYDEKGDK